MAFSKKGSRSIELDGVKFLYKTSKIKSKSDWRSEDNELDRTFISYAKLYGLGNVKDATLNIAIQSATEPVSSMFVKCHTLIVDGFLGPEQIIQIKPNLVLQLINIGINDKWNPSKKGNYKLELAQKWIGKTKYVLLHLPNMDITIKDFKTLKRPVEIKLND